MNFLKTKFQDIPKTHTDFIEELTRHLNDILFMKEKTAKTKETAAKGALVFGTVAGGTALGATIAAVATNKSLDLCKALAALVGVFGLIAVTLGISAMNNAEIKKKIDEMSVGLEKMRDMAESNLENINDVQRLFASVRGKLGILCNLSPEDRAAFSELELKYTAGVIVEKSTKLQERCKKFVGKIQARKVAAS